MNITVTGATGFIGRYLVQSLAKDGPNDVLRRLAVEAARKIRARPAPAVVPPALAVDRRTPPGAASP